MQYFKGYSCFECIKFDLRPQIILSQLAQISTQLDHKLAVANKKRASQGTDQQNLNPKLMKVNHGFILLYEVTNLTKKLIFKN